MNLQLHSAARRLCVFVALTLASSSCDKGLAPPVVTTLSGTMLFRGTWPPKDSVRNLALVLVPRFPPFKVDSLIGDVLNKAALPILLNYKSSDTSYSYPLQPGRYGYLGIAQQYDSLIFKDWRVVGFAHDASDSAIHFNVKFGDEIIVPPIIVNFDSLPRQPFVQ